jgi:excisionase family DNA binding protein
MAGIMGQSVHVYRGIIRFDIHYSGASMTTISNLLSPNEVAERLGVTRGTLAVWRCKKRYPLRFVKIGSKIQYRAEDVQRFIERRTVGAKYGE